jgi:hypothetical protein
MRNFGRRPKKLWDNRRLRCWRCGSTDKLRRNCSPPLRPEHDDGCRTRYDWHWKKTNVSRRRRNGGSGRKLAFRLLKVEVPVALFSHGTGTSREEDPLKLSRMKRKPHHCYALDTQSSWWTWTTTIMIRVEGPIREKICLMTVDADAVVSLLFGYFGRTAGDCTSRKIALRWHQEALPNLREGLLTLLLGWHPVTTSLNFYDIF